MEGSRYVEVRGHLEGAPSFLPPCGTQGLNSGLGSSVVQVPSPAEPSQQLMITLSAGREHCLSMMDTNLRVKRKAITCSIDGYWAFLVLLGISLDHCGLQHHHGDGESL